MKLNTLWISHYKNLQNTEITFENEDSIVAIIGNNGTGKSNLVEALLHIFVGLYYDDPPLFGYRITYEAHGKQVRIECEDNARGPEIRVDGDRWSRSRFKKRARKTELLPPFPALIFGYYSGTCDRIGNQLRRYQRSYAAKLRRQSDNLERRFIVSEIEQSEWMLIALFAHQHHELLDKLSINSIKKLRVTIRQPGTYRPDIDEPTYWGKEGGFRDFLVALETRSSEQESFSKRANPTQEENYSGEERTYVFDSDQLAALGHTIGLRGTTVYSLLQVLHSSNMLVDLHCSFTHQEFDHEIAFPDLSEGEKQLISVIGGLWLAKQHECLVLLDEPDTHLNPQWSSVYTQLLEDSLESDQRLKSTVLVATHDPMLIADLTAKQVLIAKNNAGQPSYSYPIENPQGLGVGGILTSEMFGLMTTLDHKTSDIIAQRRAIISNPELTEENKAALAQLNDQLDQLGYNFVHPDEDYRQFLIARKHALSDMDRADVSTVEQRLELINNILADKGYTR